MEKDGEGDRVEKDGDGEEWRDGDGEIGMGSRVVERWRRVERGGEIEKDGVGILGTTYSIHGVYKWSWQR